jgi:hypothetical protein
MNKLQSLLIEQLQKNGCVKLILPDEVVVEIGVNQLDGNGDLKNTENYCWVIASRKDRMTVLDSYNLGVRYPQHEQTLIFEDQIITSEGEKMVRLDVV